MGSRVRTGTSLAGLVVFLTICVVLSTWDVRVHNNGVVLRPRGQERNKRQVTDQTSGLWRSAFEGLVGQDTADALERDQTLRRSLGAAIDLTGQLSRDLAERFDLPVLREVGESLDEYRRRSELDDAETADGSKDATSEPTKTSLPRPSPVKRQGLLDLLPSLPVLGGGGGGGAATDLLSGAFNALLDPLKNVISSVGDGLLKNLGGAALSMGIGLGAGTAQGLNLTTGTKATAMAGKIAADNGVPATGLNGAVQNLAMGASAVVVGAVGSMLNGNGTGGGALDLSTVLGNTTLAEAALRLADGLGSGVVKGLKLATPTTDPAGNKVVVGPQAPTGTSIGDTVGAFGFGLSDSLTRYLDLTQISPGSFMTGLVSGVSFGSVAQGFARGLLQGAGNSINMMGGVGAFINGTVVLPSSVPNDTVAFNDTLGGASTGFGQGLGGQGVLVATQLVAKMFPDRLPGISGVRNGVARRTPDVDDDDGDHWGALVVRQTNGTGPSSPGFNLTGILNAQSLSVATQQVMDLLQCEGIGGVVLLLIGLSRGGALPSASLQNPPQLDPNVADVVRQIVPNGTIFFSSSGNNYAVDGRQLLKVLDPGANVLATALAGISINGMAAVPFTVVMVFHIVIALSVLIFTLPLVLGLDTARSVLTTRMRMPEAVPFPRVLPRLISALWLFVIGPGPVVALVFGAVAVGNSAHFRSAHGILGLLTVVFGILATVLFFIDSRKPALRARIARRLGGGGGGSGGDVLDEKVVIAEPGLGWSFVRALFNQLFQSLAVATAITGFHDLGGVMLCISQALPFAISISIGFGLAGMSLVGTLLAWFDLYLAWRVSRSAKNARAGGAKRRGKGAAGRPDRDMEEDSVEEGVGVVRVVAAPYKNGGTKVAISREKIGPPKLILTNKVYQ